MFLDLFPSWTELQRNREVVLFTCGLMSDPTPLVDHVYQMWIIENANLSVRKYHDTSLLQSLYTEGQLPGHPLHNQHINCYNHYQEGENIPRDIDVTPMFVRSKHYDFFCLSEDISCDFRPRTQETEIPDFTIRISMPNETVSKSLLTNCGKISQSQGLTKLQLFHVVCVDLPEPNVFNLSTHVQSLIVKECTLPSQTLNHLIQQIDGWTLIYMRDVKEMNGKTVYVHDLSVRFAMSGESSFGLYNNRLPSKTLSHLIEQINGSRTLNKIVFEDTNLKDVPSLSLNNKISLNYFALKHTNISPDLMHSISKQLFDMRQLHYLDLSGNDFTQVTYLILSNKPSLKHLYLQKTRMSSELYQTIYRQLPDLQWLKHIHVSTNNFEFRIGTDSHRLFNTCNVLNTYLPENLCGRLLQHINRFVDLTDINMTSTPLTGSLSILLQDPHTGLPKLQWLRLSDTKLNKGDLQHLSKIVQPNKLPNLGYLDLSFNTLTGCLSSFLPDSHPGLPLLEELDMEHTALNEGDLQHLSNITQNNKLPRLRILDLSDNILAGCLSGFLPDPNPGLPRLQNLYLHRTALNHEDLHHLSKITQRNKLPNLRCRKFCEKIFVQVTSKSSSKITLVKMTEPESYCLKQRESKTFTKLNTT